MRWLLVFSVFVSGAAVMVLELAGARLAAPSLEADSYAWAALIAVTLSALALGYWLGGKWSDRAPSANVLFRILAAAAVLIAVAPWMRDLVTAIAAPLGPRAGALVRATLMFAAPITLLGMAYPFAVRLRTQGLDSVGATTGRFGAISTAGSLAGTLLAGFLPTTTHVVPPVLIGSCVALFLPGLIHWLMRASDNARSRMRSARDETSSLAAIKARYRAR
jgi:MFS family permease